MFKLTFHEFVRSRRTRGIFDDYQAEASWKLTRFSFLLCLFDSVPFSILFRFFVREKIVLWLKDLVVVLWGLNKADYRGSLFPQSVVKWDIVDLNFRNRSNKREKINCSLDLYKIDGASCNHSRRVALKVLQ